MIIVMEPEAGENALKIAAPAHRHRHRADGIFEDEIPADHPREDFAERGVGIGVGAARDGNHRRQLGITQRRERTHYRNQYQRKRQCRARAGTSRRGGMVDDEVEKRRVQHRRGKGVCRSSVRTREHVRARGPDRCLRAGSLPGGAAGSRDLELCHAASDTVSQARQAPSAALLEG